MRVGDLDLTVEDIEPVNTKAFNQFNDANVRAKVVAVNARGRADRTYDIAIFAFKVIDGNGVAHPLALGCAGCPGAVTNVSLTQGGMVRGYLYFAVPGGSTLSELRYEPLLSTNKAFISLGR